MNTKRAKRRPMQPKFTTSFFVPALFAEWPERVLRGAHVQAGDAVLDVACGTGILAREAADLVGARGSVTGVDINEGMLSLARQRSPDIIWKAGPAESLPFEPATFDRVVSQFGLTFFDDPTNAILEMGRVLRPRGTLAIAVWGPLDGTPGYAAIAQIFDELYGPEVAESMQTPFLLGDRQVLASLSAAAGMEDVVIDTIVGRARFPTLEAWISTDIAGWKLAGRIDDESSKRLKRYARHRLSRFVLADGSVEFDATAHIVSVKRD